MTYVRSQSKLVAEEEREAAHWLFRFTGRNTWDYVRSPTECSSFFMTNPNPKTTLLALPKGEVISTLASGGTKLPEQGWIGRFCLCGDETVPVCQRQLIVPVL